MCVKALKVNEERPKFFLSKLRCSDIRTFPYVVIHFHCCMAPWAKEFVHDPGDIIYLRSAAVHGLISQWWIGCGALTNLVSFEGSKIV
jgi:hypothetical protein